MARMLWSMYGDAPAAAAGGMEPEPDEEEEALARAMEVQYEHEQTAHQPDEPARARPGSAGRRRVRADDSDEEQSQSGGSDCAVDQGEEARDPGGESEEGRGESEEGRGDAHWEQAREGRFTDVYAGDSDAEAEHQPVPLDGFNAPQGGAQDSAVQGPSTVERMPGFDSLYLGKGRNGMPPNLSLGQMAGGWTTFGAARAGWEAPAPGLDSAEGPPTKKRAMCINIPAEMFRRGAERFMEWNDSKTDQPRAARLAALVGLICAGSSKGILSGNHIEIQQRQNRQDDEGNQDAKKDRPVTRVRSYMSQIWADKLEPRPMFTLGIEYLPNRRDSGKIEAVRVWKIVYDGAHSDSELVQAVIDESRTNSDSSGYAHSSACSQKPHTSRASKQRLGLIGGATLTEASVADFGGTLFAHTRTTREYLDLVFSYGGNLGCDGPSPLIRPGDVPPGVHNLKLEKAPDSECGTRSAIGPEWLLNPDRVDGQGRSPALRAGLRDMEGNELDVHPDCLDRDNYCHLETGELRAPFENQFFLNPDANVNSFWDTVLPAPLVGVCVPGPALTALYREVSSQPHVPIEILLDSFWTMARGQEEQNRKRGGATASSGFSFDTFEADTQQRMAASRKASVGATAADSMKTPNAIKGISAETKNIFRKIFSPWAAKGESALAGMAAGAAKQKADEAFRVRRNDVVHDIFCLHARLIEHTFQSPEDSRNCPPGWLAAWLNLQETLALDKSGSADVSRVLDIQMMCSGTTTFGNLTGWINSFAEDCFFDGRSEHFEQSLLHVFEAYGQNSRSLVQILAGKPGTGKTELNYRLSHLLGKGIMQTAGNQSEKAGLQGNNSALNGCAVYHDEMPTVLFDPNKQEGRENFKQEVLNGKLFYSKTMPTKNMDGTEGHRTVHIETECVGVKKICTNYGCAPRPDKKEVDDTDVAIWSRCKAFIVRPQGTKARSWEEFTRHLGTPRMQRKVHAFRVIASLTMIVKLLIYDIDEFHPNPAAYAKIVDFFENSDHGTRRAYGLPATQPRKANNIEETCLTLSVMNAVATVFLYKQTSHEFACNRKRDPDTGEYVLKKFDIADLWHVIQLLQPSPEIILYAWSLGREFTPGLNGASHATMSALAEAFGLDGKSLSRVEPPGPPEQYASTKEVWNSFNPDDCENYTKAQEAYEQVVQDAGGERDKQKKNTRDAAERLNAKLVSQGQPPKFDEATICRMEAAAGDSAYGAALPKTPRPAEPQRGLRDGEFPRLFARLDGTDYDPRSAEPGQPPPPDVTPDFVDQGAMMSQEELSALEQRLRQRRVRLSQYRARCAGAQQKDEVIDNVLEACERTANSLPERLPPPRNLQTPAPRGSSPDSQKMQGRKFFAENKGAPPPRGAPEPFKKGYHEARAEIYCGPFFCNKNHGSKLLKAVKDRHTVRERGGVHRPPSAEAAVENSRVWPVMDELRTQMEACPYCVVAAAQMTVIEVNCMDVEDECATSDTQVEEAVDQMMRNGEALNMDRGQREQMLQNIQQNQHVETYTLPKATSELLPTPTDISVFYPGQRLMDWMSGIASTDCNAERKTRCTGTREELFFAEKLGGQFKVADFAWLELHPALAPTTNTWPKLAKYIMNSAQCASIRRVGFHDRGLQDLMLLLSLDDAKRPAPVALPEFKYSKSPWSALISVGPPGPADGAERDVSEEACNLRLVPWNSRGEGSESFDHEEWPRHPDCGPSTVQQRRFDSATLAKRLPAANLYFSDRCEMTQPIREQNGKIQANTGALIAFQKLHFEMALRVQRSVPGARNRQEVHCYGSRGPEGWSCFEDPPAPGSERARALALSEFTHTLPCSYDHVNIGLTCGMHDFFFDDGLHERQATSRATNALFEHPEANDLSLRPPPETTIAYRGFDEADNRPLSLKVNLERPERNPRVEAGDPSAELAGVTKEIVERNECRKLTDEEFREIVSTKLGSRRMGSRKRDLFSIKEILAWNVQAAIDQGLLSGSGPEAARRLIEDQASMCRARAAEFSSCNGDQRFEYLKLSAPENNTYGAQEERERARNSGFDEDRAETLGKKQRVVPGAGALRAG